MAANSSPTSAKRPFSLTERLNLRNFMSQRKKSKPNPKAPATPAAGSAPEPEPSPSQTPPETTAPNTPSTSQISINPSLKTAITDSTQSSASTVAADASSRTLTKKPSRKWYGGTGSWRSKAPPVAQIAKESIGVTGGAITSELPGEDSRQPQENSPKKLLSRKSSKGDAIPASMTKLHVSSDGSVKQEEAKEPEQPKASEPEAPPERKDEEPPSSTTEPPLPPDPQSAGTTEDKSSRQPNVDTGTFGWRSWWSRPDGYSETSKPTDKENTADDTVAQATPLPAVTPSENTSNEPKELGDSVKASVEQASEVKNTPQAIGESKSEATAQNRSSWFWLWSSAQNAQTNPPPPESTVNTKKEDAAEPHSSKTDPATQPAAVTSPPVPEETAVESLATKPIEAPSRVEPDATDKTSKSAPKSSGWAFWSREKPKEESTDPGSAHKQVGEIAVSDTPSQSRPEAAQFNEQESETQKLEPPKPAKQPKVKSIRGRAKVRDSSGESSNAATPSNVTPTASPARVEIGAAPQPVPKQAIKAKQEVTNLLLPEFRNTYHLVQKPSYWQQIRQYFLGGETAMPHLHINPAPPRIKRAIAIGVHGYFPAPIIQKVLGQPTGTSIRFANAAATAIQEWTEARGYSAEIEKVALEGEGFIADRVNTLWKLLLNWIDHIKAADFILVACHSQGVPVAIMLVAKLIQFGCVNAARIGVCAMAGVNLGPFAEYKTKYLGATAAELFQFSDPESLVSKMYLAALEEVLRYGVRILYVGSIDDQLVSLESSTFSNLSHPYIYRAVFVDGRIHAPDFITHLVGFALKLRNLGLPDHGLIRELSPALAGSLYSGEGHSRLYEEPRIYSLAVSHALETTSLPISPTQQRPATAGLIIPGLPVSAASLSNPANTKGKQNVDPYALKVRSYEGTGSGNQNPFYLPWAMRGLLEEEFVKKELSSEVEDLLTLFEDWRPTSKGLRDVRFRLEAVKSKL